MFLILPPLCFLFKYPFHVGQKYESRFSGVSGCRLNYYVNNISQPAIFSYFNRFDICKCFKFSSEALTRTTGRSSWIIGDIIICQSDGTH